MGFILTITKFDLTEELALLREAPDNVNSWLSFNNGARGELVYFASHAATRPAIDGSREEPIDAEALGVALRQAIKLARQYQQHNWELNWCILLDLLRDFQRSNDESRRRTQLLRSLMEPNNSKRLLMEELRDKSLSLDELTGRLGCTRQQINYLLRVLSDAALVRCSGAGFARSASLTATGLANMDRLSKMSLDLSQLPQPRDLSLKVVDHEESVDFNEKTKEIDEASRTAFLHLKAPNGRIVRAEIPAADLDPLLALI